MSQMVILGMSNWSYICQKVLIGWLHMPKKKGMEGTLIILTDLNHLGATHFSTLCDLQWRNQGGVWGSKPPPFQIHPVYKQRVTPLDIS